MVTTDPHRGAAVARAGERPLGDPLHSDRDERVVDPRIDRDDRVGLTSAAPITAASPIPPQPNTRTASAGRTFARPVTDITPVVTPHPSSHASVGSSSSVTATVPATGTTAWWAKEERTRGGAPAPRRGAAAWSRRPDVRRPDRRRPWRIGSSPLQAEAAMSARRRERQHHAVATASWVDPLPHVLDHRTPLVAQHDRQRDRPRTVDVGQVAVADAGGEQAHQHLATAWRLELDLDHLRRRTDLCEHGRSGTDSH